MINLKVINEDNFLDAFQLRLADGQEKYVSNPIRSLAQAYVYRKQCQPFGIYDGDEMVGYVMVIYDYDIPEYDIDIITGSKHLADIFETCVALGSQPKKVSNWLMVETLRLLKENGLDAEDIRFSPENLSKLIRMTDAKEINSSVAKEVFEAMFKENVDPEAYVEEKGLKTVNDEGALRKTVEQVIAENPQSVEDYRNGKEKAIGFLVGQTMKAMKGKADPGMVNKLLKELL